MKKYIIASMLCCSFILLSTHVQAEEKVALSVKDAVETALARNLNLRLVEQGVEEALGEVNRAKGRFDEYIKVESSYKQYEYSPLSVGGATLEEQGNVDLGITKRLSTGTELGVSWRTESYKSDIDGLFYDPAYSTGLSVDVVQPLLQGFGTDVQSAEQRAAEQDVAVARFQVESLVADLAAEVKRRYWELVFARTDIEVKRFSVSLAEKLLSETKAKISVGRLAEIEIYQPQSEVARREEELITAERAIGFAEDELKLLMNIDNWDVLYVPTDNPPRDDVHVNANEILENALLNRADLGALQGSIEASLLRKNLAQDQLRPVLNLVGGIGYGGV